MSIYTHTERFDSGRAISEDEMRTLALSIFAMTAHESRSERFQPIPTIEILRSLTQEGFVPVGVKQSATRIEGKADYTKHLIRLRRVDDGKTYHVGDSICEILLKNANDGTIPYELMAGMFRIRCMNSLVAQTGTIDTTKVRHSGDLAGEVIEGTYRVLEEAERTLSAPQDWSNLSGRKPVLPDVAARLGKLFGDGAAVWLRIQASFDAWHAEWEVDTSAVSTLKAA